MKLQQLRFLREVVKQGLNVSAAADKLYTSQPGVSKQIKLLEEELGVDVFVRSGKRIVDLTEPGKIIVGIVERILRESNNLKKVSEDFRSQLSGSLTIATTHTQARYALPHVIKTFLIRYPDVKVNILQGSPSHIGQQVVNGTADIAIATESLHLFQDLKLFSCYDWNRCIITPHGHPLLALESPLTLQDIARYPIITYDSAFAGRSKINKAFADLGLNPNIVLTAIDSDVIKTYVEIGMGIGILARMAYDPMRDLNVQMIEAGHLFEPSTTSVAIRKNSYLRDYVFAFIELFAPHLNRETIEAQL